MSYLKLERGNQILFFDEDMFIMMYNRQSFIKICNYFAENRCRAGGVYEAYLLFLDCLRWAGQTLYNSDKWSIHGFPYIFELLVRMGRGFLYA